MAERFKNQFLQVKIKKSRQVVLLKNLGNLSVKVLLFLFCLKSIFVTLFCFVRFKVIRMPEEKPTATISIGKTDKTERRNSGIRPGTTLNIPAGANAVSNTPSRNRSM